LEWIESQRTRWEALFDAVGEYLEAPNSSLTNLGG
jgi:hypothetical protein